MESLGQFRSRQVGGLGQDRLFPPHPAVVEVHLSTSCTPCIPRDGLPASFLCGTTPGTAGGHPLLVPGLD